MSDKWTPNCTHMVTSKEVVTTVKAIHTAIAGVPIVTPKWVAALQNLKLKAPMPDLRDKNHMPVRTQLDNTMQGVPAGDPRRSHCLAWCVEGSDAPTLFESSSRLQNSTTSTSSLFRDLT